MDISDNKVDEEEEEAGSDSVDVEDCEEDIYGDLETEIFGPAPKKPKYDQPYEKLIEANEALVTRVKKLEKANKTYASNINALYLTAKSEVDKKNFIIKNLTEKLKQVTKSKSTLSKDEAEAILTKCQEALVESQAQVTLQEIKKSLRSTSPSKAGKKKLVRFGNMSIYFFREEGCFQRGENVNFPQPTPPTNPHPAASSATGSERTKSQDPGGHSAPNHEKDPGGHSAPNHEKRGRNDYYHTRSSTAQNRHNVNSDRDHNSSHEGRPQHPGKTVSQDKGSNSIPPPEAGYQHRRKSTDSDGDRDPSKQHRTSERTSTGYRDDERPRRSSAYSRDFESRKPDNFRDGGNRRNVDHRTRPPSNRTTNDSRYTSSNNRKYRSRSKSR